MKSSKRLYIPLALLFLVSMAFQVANTIGPARATGKPAASVFLPFQVKTASATIVSIRPEAAEAGLKNGDILVAVGGHPYTGSAVFAREFAKLGAGGKLHVTFRSPAAGAPDQTVDIPIVASATRFTNLGVELMLIVNFLLVPYFCLFLGFWVASVRPYDRLAWLLLAIMLSFSQLVEVHPEFWPPIWRDLGTAYHLLLQGTWPIWMFLFGIYFPEPFPPRRSGRIWRAITWGIISMLGLLSVIQVVLALGDMESYSSVAWIERIFPQWDTADTILTIAALGGFFGMTLAKIGSSSSPDVKRRLRLLYAGTSIALAPIFLLSMYALARRSDLSDPRLAPGWLLIFAFVMTAFFPLTLAYLIVIHKAMDVRVVIRQGLQYAFAANGIRALRVGIVSLIVFLAVSVFQHEGQGRIIWKILAVGLAVVLGIKLRQMLERLKLWIDRRFFRDAYNAETVLEQLSDKVRSMVETRPLLETVSRSIAESLHVSRVAVLLQQNGVFAPAYALGYENPPPVTFGADEVTVRHLSHSMEPARVYLDDPNSWVNRSADVSADERRKLEQLGAQLILPLGLKEKLVGFLSLSEKRSEEPYSGSDVRLLRSVAAQTGLALENAQLTRAIAHEVAQREKLNRELEIAREVQERLFPQKLPGVEGLDFSGACRPALGVGGDYYDFLALPGGGLGIAIGDVSGKGIAAALMMATLQASLRSEATRGPENLAALMASVNRLVYEASSVNRYATFFYGQYDPQLRRLAYVNAGHNPPFLLRHGQTGVERLEAGGVVVGLLLAFNYQQAVVELRAGDTLVAYTDGVSESMNLADEEWGEDRMLASIQACDGQPASGVIEKVMKDAQSFAAGAPQHDDMTMVVLRVTEGG